MLLPGDGSIIVGGEFASMGSVTARSLARMDTNGVVDQAFALQLGGGFNGPVNDVALQNDGGTLKYLVGGQFTTLGGNPHNNLARILSTGARDATFVASADAFVNDIEIDSSGRLLVAGGFTVINGIERGRIARLSASGAMDTAINFGAGADGEVKVVLEQFHDQRIVVGGSFGFLWSSTKVTHRASERRDHLWGWHPGLPVIQFQCIRKRHHGICHRGSYRWPDRCRSRQFHDQRRNGYFSEPLYGSYCERLHPWQRDVDDELCDQSRSGR